MDGRRDFFMLCLFLSAWMLSAVTTASAQCSFPLMPSQTNYDYSSPDFQSVFTELNSTIATFVSQNGISSYAVAVVLENQTIYTSGLTKTPFRCASITKTFTALGALMLRERGLLSLDDPVNKFLPDFSIINPYGNHNTTLRELMAHVSGMPEQLCPYLHTCTDDETVILNQIAGMQLEQPPWSSNPIYSNLGIALLGHAWEKATSPLVSWWDFLRDNVVTPLQMTNTGINLSNIVLAPNLNPWATQDLGWSAPAAQMYTTAEDLAKYLGFLITASPALISDASRREWIRPTKLYSDGQGGYAMPWELRRLASNISSEFLVTKLGDINGYRSHIAFHQATQLGVAVLTVYKNPYLPQPSPDALVDAILTILIPEVQILTNVPITETYAGVYTCAASPGFASPTLNYTVAVLGGTITVTSNSSRGLLATMNVTLQNEGFSPYVVGGPPNALLLKNATENSFWFGDGSVCFWFLGGLSSQPDLKNPNTPESLYTNELKFDLATSSVLWPTVGANCTIS